MSVNFKDIKKVNHILANSLNLKSFLFTFCPQFLEIKDDIQVISQFSCLLGHPVDNFICLDLI